MLCDTVSCDTVSCDTVLRDTMFCDKVFCDTVYRQWSVIQCRLEWSVQVVKCTDSVVYSVQAVECTGSGVYSHWRAWGETAIRRVPGICTQALLYSSTVALLYSST